MPRYPKWAIDQTAKFADDWCRKYDRKILAGERRSLIQELLADWPSNTDHHMNLHTVTARDARSVPPQAE